MVNKLLKKKPGTDHWKGIVFNKCFSENYTVTRERMKLDHHSTPYTKINSKWIKDLNIRPQTLKLLQENTGGNSLTSLLEIIFWIGHQKAKATNAKINR